MTNRLRLMGRTLAGAALLGLPLLACGSSTASTTTASTDSTSADVSLIDQLLGQRTGEQLAFVEERITLCMKADGFEYVPQPIDEVPDPYVENYYTLESRETSGLGISLGAVTDEGQLEEAATDNDLYLATLSGAEFEEWTIQEGRCFDEAWTAVEKTFAQATESLPPTLLEEVTSVTFHTSAAFNAPMEQWSECMRNAGFEYSDQVTMFIELQTEFDGQTRDANGLENFQEREIATAIADLQCYENHVADAAEKASNELEAQLEDALGSSSIYD